MSDDPFINDFEVPGEGDNEPREIFERLVNLCDNFEHLKNGAPHVEFLLRTQTKIKQGREILGTCYLPSVQGELRPMFDWMMMRTFGDIPDFLIVLDRDYWLDSDPMAREILIFHEAMHCDHAKDKYGAPRFDKDTGRPVWGIRGHDVEEFNEVVRRYGAHSHEIKSFLAAAGANLNKNGFDGAQNIVL